MDLTYKPIEGKSRGYRIMVAILGVMVAVLVASYLVAYLKGFQVWGISNAVPWGQLITLDIYFIGLSAGAIVVSGLSYVLGREEYKPIGRQYRCGLFHRPLNGILSYFMRLKLGWGGGGVC